MGGSSIFRGVALISSLSALLILHCIMELPVAAPMRLSELFAKQGLEAPDLSKTGSAIRNVLMVSMGSGYCGTGRDDWRGDLPRYLAHFMPKASSFIVDSRRGLSKTCRACLPDITSSGESTSFTCSEHMHKKPDLVIVFGTGVAHKKQKCHETQANWTSCAQANYPSLMSLQKAKLLKDTTITVHFPVRTISELYKNPFEFTHVVSDDSYFKPVAYGTAAELSKCAGKPKDQTLVYVARYTPHKGQVEFVQRLDPSMLGNYTLHFYGGEDSSDYAKLLKQEIKRTGIRAVVHGRVPHDELLSAVCRSAGQIHTALKDNNPRVAYEALFAGNPLFISKQSNTPGSVLTLPFVQATDMSDPSSLQNDFADFLSNGLNRQWESSISKFANTHMNSLAVYRQICESIGICKQLMPSRNSSSRKRVPANTVSSPTSSARPKKTPNAAPAKIQSSKHKTEN